MHPAPAGHAPGDSPVVQNRTGQDPAIAGSNVPSRRWFGVSGPSRPLYAVNVLNRLPISRASQRSRCGTDYYRTSPRGRQRHPLRGNGAWEQSTVRSETTRAQSIGRRRCASGAEACRVDRTGYRESSSRHHPRMLPASLARRGHAAVAVPHPPQLGATVLPCHRPAAVVAGRTANRYLDEATGCSRDDGPPALRRVRFDHGADFPSVGRQSTSKAPGMTEHRQIAWDST